MAAVVWIAGSSPASAGIFDFIFGPPKQQQAPAAPPPSAAPAPAPAPVAPRPSALAPVMSAGNQRAYCVRTCDGYYFAIGFVRNKSQLQEDDQMCAASCDGMEMKLYSAPVQRDPRDNAAAIERATDAGGVPYTALPNANAFRTAENGACSCRTSNGLPQIPISADPTLRNGDIVVTPEGLKVFRGKPTETHTSDDFVGVADAKSLPGVVRQQMLSLQNRIAQ